MSTGINVGQPVMAQKLASKFIGICHAIDSRIEGGRIIKEVKVLIVAEQGDGMEFFEPCHDSDSTLFEMKEVFPLLVDIRLSDDA